MKEEQELPLDQIRCPQCGSSEVRRLQADGILPALFRILGSGRFVAGVAARIFTAPRPLR